MAEAGAEPPVVMEESFANGKAPEDEVMEEGMATEHKEVEITKEEMETQAEDEKSVVKEDDKEKQNGTEDGKSLGEETAKNEGKVETQKRKRGKAQGLSSPVKGGEGSTVKESGKTKAKDSSTPTVSAIDRPSRERKTIERFVASSEKETVKEFTIEKGKGVPFRDIPNVAFKVSKRSRADENLKTLHRVLYGRRGKAVHVKNNILQFSGFVWGEDEEKEKAKLKDRLDKLHKEALVNISDVMDIHVKSTTKKEEMVVKLIEFLDAPHATTDVLLEQQKENLKAKKRKKRSKGTPGKTTGKASGKNPIKRRRKNVGSKEVIERTEEESEGDEDVEEEKETDLGDDNPGSEKEAENEEEDEEDDEDYGQTKKVSKRSTKKGSSRRRKSNESVGKKNLESSPKKSLRSPSKGSTPKDSAGNNAISSPKNSPTSKVFSRKNKKEKSEVNKPASEVKKQSRKQTNVSVEKPSLKEKDGKTKAKGKSSTSDPSDEELRSAISEILKGVDFNTATFTDIVKRLAGQFDMDLTERKAHVKVLIQEELSKLAEGDEGDDDEDQSIGAEGNAEKDESDEMT
ncbi:hypothetical protein KI387_001505, partial [Taxus chinensis]